MARVVHVRVNKLHVSARAVGDAARVGKRSLGQVEADDTRGPAARKADCVRSDVALQVDDIFACVWLFVSVISSLYAAGVLGCEAGPRIGGNGRLSVLRAGGGSAIESTQECVEPDSCNKVCDGNGVHLSEFFHRCRGDGLFGQ